MLWFGEIFDCVFLLSYEVMVFHGSDWSWKSKNLVQISEENQKFVSRGGTFSGSDKGECNWRMFSHSWVSLTSYELTSNISHKKTQRCCMYQRYTYLVIINETNTTMYYLWLVQEVWCHRKCIHFWLWRWQYVYHLYCGSNLSRYSTTRDIYLPTWLEKTLTKCWLTILLMSSSVSIRRT